jgi:type VI protein secretion system component Hcp
MILVHIDGVMGDCKIDGYEGDASGDRKKTGWFVADSFTFGVQREMKESGEKSGTEDINIGVGELQECNIGKSMDQASPLLAQFAISGSALGTAYVDFVEIAGATKIEGKPFCYLRFKLDRCFVKSWTVNGDADDRPTEEVAFYYNKIAFEYVYLKGDKEFKSAGLMTWDNVRNEPWKEPNIDLLNKKAGSI